MREIDRVRRRQRWRRRSDRTATIMVTVLVIVAGLTLLPPIAQQRLLSWGCAGVTLGVTDCVARLYEPPTSNLRAVPLCPVDQVREEMVPTVERQAISFSGGGQLERWVDRSGIVRVVARPEVPPDGPVEPWNDETWPEVTLLPGVDLPLAARWTFDETGEELTFVSALQRAHALQDQETSAIAALLPSSIAREVDEATVPGTWAARTTMPTVVVPTEATATSPTIGLSEQRVVGDHADLLHDLEDGQVLTTVATAGATAEGAPSYGALRWARDETGRLTELIGTFAGAEEDGVTVIQLLLPLQEGDDDDLEGWLSSPGGPVVDLTFLTADRALDPDDAFEQLVSAAGTVTIERLSTDPAGYADTVRTQFALDRRPFGKISVERTSSELVRPQPSGAERIAQGVSC